MKCSKCGKRNVTQANYCIRCGNRFTNDERNKSKSILRVIVNIKKWYANTPIKKITDSTFYKIGTILVNIINGIVCILLNGNYLKLMESDNYSYTYDNNIGAYRLYLNKDESNINLYLPHKVNKFYVNVYDKSDNVISKNVYDDINDIKVVLDENNYYEISCSKNKTKRNTIKVYIERQL